MGAEVLIPALASLGSAGINSYSQSQGAQNQANLTKEMYDADRKREYEASQYLTGMMPNFDATLPDPNKYFGTDTINKQYDVAKANLGNTANTSAMLSAQQAGSLAGARGLANPSGFTSGAFQSTLGSFAPQFTALEGQRAGAMQNNNANLFQSLLGNTQIQNALRQMRYGNQFNLAQNFGSPNVAPTPMAQQATPNYREYDFFKRQSNPFSFGRK